MCRPGWKKGGVFAQKKSAEKGMEKGGEEKEDLNNNTKERDQYSQDHTSRLRLTPTRGKGTLKKSLKVRRKKERGSGRNAQP